MIPPYNREKGKTEWEGGESAWLSNMAQKKNSQEKDVYYLNVIVFTS